MQTMPWTTSDSTRRRPDGGTRPAPLRVPAGLGGWTTAQAGAHRQDGWDSEPGTIQASDACLGVLRCMVGGRQYHDGKLDDGEPVRLQRETSNHSYRNLLCVQNVRGQTVGYVRREYADVLSPMVDDGLVRLEGVCAHGSRDPHMTAVDVSVLGRPAERAVVRDRLRRLGYELDEPPEPPAASGPSSGEWQTPRPGCASRPAPAAPLEGRTASQAVAHRQVGLDSEPGTIQAGDACLGVMRCMVGGRQYYDGKLDDGEPVRLQRETSDRFDRNSLCVRNARDQMVGYVKREYANVLSPMVDDGLVRLEGVCAHGGRDPHVTAVDVSVLGRSAERNVVRDRLRRQGYELDEPPEPPAAAGPCGEDWQAPLDLLAEVDSSWQAVQQKLLEAEPCAAVTAAQAGAHRQDGLDSEPGTIQPGDACLGVLRCMVGGRQYHDGKLDDGEPVRLQRETSNSFNRNALCVQNIRGQTVGYVKREYASVLSPMVDDGLVRLEGVCAHGGRDPHMTAVDVSVLGRPAERTVVRDRLRRLGYELDEPPEPPAASGPCGGEWQAPLDLLAEVDSDWQAVQEELREAEPCAAVRRRLYPHQKQALAWMMARERADELPPLWSRLPDGRFFNSATNTSTVARPAAVLGGILADDMGLGKTLQVIALVLTNFRDGRPLAVPVPGLPRCTPVAAARQSAPSSSVRFRSPPTRKIDWSLFRWKLHHGDAEGAGTPAGNEKPKRDKGDAGGQNQKKLSEPSALGDVGSKPKRVKLEGPDDDDDILADVDTVSPVPGGDQYVPVVPVDYDRDGRSRRHGPRTTLIVCPLSVLGIWQAQLVEHVHRHVYLKVRTFHGPQRCADDLDDADVVLTTYGTLTREHAAGSESVLLGRTYLRLVLDEGHAIRNPRSRQASAAFGVRAERRWVLTATPVQNLLKDLWSLLRVLRVEPFAERSVWVNSVEKPAKRGRPDGVKLLRELMAGLALRRLKTQKVGGRPLVALPPREVRLQRVTMSGDQRRVYDVLEAESRRNVERFIAQGEVARRHVLILVMLLRLRQICCHPALVPAAALSVLQDRESAADCGLSQQERQDLVAAVREILDSGSDEECPVCMEPLTEPIITACAHVFCRPCMRLLLNVGAGDCDAHCPLCRGPLRPHELVDPAEELPAAGDQEPAAEGPVSSAKLDALMDGLAAIREEDGGRKTVVVSQFTRLLDLVQERLRRAGFIFRRLDGTMDLARRLRSIEEFSAEAAGAPTVLLLSLRAGGEGINLVAASRVFLLDPAWNPASEEQCFDRCHRLGQTQPVLVVKLVVVDSVEDRMLELQERKRELMRRALGGLSRAPEQHGFGFEEDLRTLFDIGTRRAPGEVARRGGADV